MTQSEINHYRAAASLGIIDDEINPIFLFNQTNAELLLGILNGKIDAVQFARMEMWNRGLNEKTGQWIGWKKDEDNYQIA